MIYKNIASIIFTFFLDKTIIQIDYLANFRHGLTNPP